MTLSIYLKYTAGIFLGVVALQWVQYNLIPIPDVPTGLNIADFGLIFGLGFWIERTFNYIKSLNKKSTLSNPEDDEKESLHKIDELKRQIESIEKSLKNNDSSIEKENLNQDKDMDPGLLIIIILICGTILASFLYTILYGL